MIKDIKGFEGLYKIDSSGKIFSKRGEVKQHGNGRGYIQVTLSKNNIARKFAVHRIIATAFCEGYSQGFEVNHKNGIKNDNRIENLEWCTRSENQKHKYSLGAKRAWLGKKGKLHIKSMGIMQIGKNGNIENRWESMTEAGIALGYSTSTISRKLKKGLLLLG